MSSDEVQRNAWLTVPTLHPGNCHSGGQCRRPLPSSPFINGRRWNDPCHCGSGSKWDAHSKIEANHSQLCRASDKPVAGLLKDLKRRGLLDSTLVIWGGEFGRTPMSEGTNGRDHNPHGFSMWLAGGGVKGGQALGATDPIGLRAADDVTHVHDVHATILHLLGFNHKRLTFRHNGRNERLTDNDGEVMEKALA